MHRQGLSSHPLRVRREGQHRYDAQRRLGGGHALHAGNPCDGHTLAETLE